MFDHNDVLVTRKHPILCYVTDRRSLSLAGSLAGTAALARKIEALIAAGIDCVQIREKDLSANDLSALTRHALRFTAPERSPAHPDRPRIMVNDRLDVALAEAAGGVHLGENSLPVKEAKQLAATRRPSHDFLVGVSCHSLESAKSAANEGADYIFFGPVFATPSKLAFGPPQGIDRLAAVCREIQIPVLAIGGITLGNFYRCLNAGASGIAAIRLFQDAADPAAVVRSLRLPGEAPPSSR